ncbi:MAG: class I SAM-dependent methyltransferase [Candidatus Omnitrophica bacterium]|nr:class I SAM-dependent methyltransferase [Candidatus Omnitrophota bacterium]MCG2708267.1 class I SAM-dependent methyltransferase [Candidatus Omnitrophota bacterium]
MRYAPFSEVLEVGCGRGVNLSLLAKRYPFANLRGVDINTVFIAEGNYFLKENGITTCTLLAGKADELAFSDKSIDVVFTNAVLIYIAPDKIKEVLTAMFRIAKKAVILLEQHIDSPRAIYNRGNWQRDYVSLIQQIDPSVTVSLTKISKSIWDDPDWSTCGYVIEGKLISS